MNKHTAALIRDAMAKDRARRAHIPHPLAGLEDALDALSDALTGEGDPLSVLLRATQLAALAARFIEEGINSPEQGSTTT